MSPSTVPAAARPPPLPVAADAAARPLPSYPTRPLGFPLGGALGLRAAATTEAPRAPATPFSFLCLCPRGRFLARAIARPRPALCPPPPLPRRVAPSPSRRSPSPGFRRPPGSGRPAAAVAAPSRLPGSHAGVRPRRGVSGCPSCRFPRAPEPTLAPRARPQPLGCLAVAPHALVAAAGLRLRRVAQAALLRLPAEGDPRAAESSLCKAG